MKRKSILGLILSVILFSTIFITVLNTDTVVYAASVNDSPYRVLINGIAVTDANKNDVLGNGNGEIVYTPATTEPATLTINDDCEIAGITCISNNTVITSGSSKAVTVTLTAPILLGNNGESNTITIKGNSEANTLTIKPKQTGEINTFRPIAIRSGNTLILQDGVILKDSNGTTFGGGMINVANSATLDMQGGIIQNSKVTTDNYDNTSVYLGRGGAIYVADGGSFKMSGGKIENCSATVAGGAIFSYGTVEITGGQITECSVSGYTDDGSTTVKAKGGAIYLFKGSFTMTGGTVSDNSLEDVEDMRGAGVYAASGVNVTLGGTAEIKNNKDGKENNSNLFLYDNVEFNISTDKEPKTGMQVYVTTKTSPSTDNAIKLSTNGKEADKNYIISDDDRYGVAYNTNGYLELQNAYKVTVNVNNENYGTAEAKPNSATEGTVIELSATAKSGYRFSRWESSDVDAEAGTFSMPAKDISVTAVFEEIPKYTVNFNSNGGSEVEAVSVEEGNKINEPDSPTKEGMDFEDWYTDEKLTIVFDFETPITENITLYAKWSEKELPSTENEEQNTENQQTEEPKTEEIEEANSEEPKAEEQKSKNPKTGDKGIEIWVTIMALSIIGIIGTARISKKLITK